MSSFLNLEASTEPSAPEVAKAPGTTEELTDYEIVLGRGHIASTALVAIVLMAVFSGVSYLIGKSMASKAVVAATAASVVPESVVPAPVVPAPVPQTPAPAPALPQEQFGGSQPRITTAPIFADAVPGKVYLQVGVIEKGLAAIWAEGLRSHGLESFAAPGPSDGLGLWRVLIGPLPDPQAYQRAKDTLGTLGLTNFGRRYPPQ